MSASCKRTQQAATSSLLRPPLPPPSLLHSATARLLCHSNTSSRCPQSSLHYPALTPCPRMAQTFPTPAAVPLMSAATEPAETSAEPFRTTIPTPFPPGPPQINQSYHTSAQAPHPLNCPTFLRALLALLQLLLHCQPDASSPVQAARDCCTSPASTPSALSLILRPLRALNLAINVHPTRWAPLHLTRWAPLHPTRWVPCLPLHRQPPLPLRYLGQQSPLLQLFPVATGLSPFHVATGLSPFQVATGLSPFHVVIGLSPFHVATGLSPFPVHYKAASSRQEAED